MSLILAGLVLVIGGGPSVANDLVRLWNSGFLPDVVLSANDHGAFQHLYTVDYMVAISPVHTRHQIPMDKFLRNYRYPIIAPFPWADVPLVDWCFRGDCGQTAIAVAAKHGAKRIVPVGLDGFRDGPRYFHETREYLTGRRDPMSRSIELLREETRPLIEACVNCEVRPVSGYLTRLFPAYEFV